MAFLGHIKYDGPEGWDGEMHTVYCDAPMCQRWLTFYTQELANTHYERVHNDRKHWAYIK